MYCHVVKSTNQTMLITGVPQGSIICPPLFNIFINAIVKAIYCLYFYADATTIYFYSRRFWLLQILNLQTYNQC